MKGISEIITGHDANLPNNLRDLSWGGFLSFVSVEAKLQHSATPQEHSPALQET